MYRIIEFMEQWESVIGLEIHAQIQSKSKLFSSAATSFGESPNSCVALFDAAIPGVLPVLNEYCVHQAVKTGLALGATINKYSVFDRKHYFYPDLPNGYQISQFYYPIVGRGNIEFEVSKDIKKTIGLERIHMEQDAGKSIHDIEGDFSFIDLNRAGTALMEIVTSPDFRSALEVKSFIEHLKLILEYIGTCDGNMERGNLRCDANVSVMKVGSSTFGTRCEIKNLNSTSNIVAAINYEIGRQISVLEGGGEIEQQTRLFDPVSGKTKTLRLKEEGTDYRYFRDPDLLPVELDDELIKKLEESMPELPDSKNQRYKELGIEGETLYALVKDFHKSEYLDKLLSLGVKNPRIAANWVNVEMSSLGCNFKNPKLSPDSLWHLMILIDSGQISQKIAKEVAAEMFETGKSAKEIVQEKGHAQMSDLGELETLVKTVLDKNPEKLNEYKSGKLKLFGFFVGETMKESKGKANPGILNDILKKLLG